MDFRFRGDGPRPQRRKIAMVGSHGIAEQLGEVCDLRPRVPTRPCHAAIDSVQNDCEVASDSQPHCRKVSGCRAARPDHVALQFEEDLAAPEGHVK